LELIRPLAEEIGKAGTGQGERLREGLRVAIAGPPNAGKSALFNRLARREAAIVSPFPGTTRDVLELHLDLGGYPVTVLDTAGIRESEDPVEREGVRRATEQALAADLVLWVVDATARTRDEPCCSRGTIEVPAGTAVWVLVNKIDLVPQAQPSPARAGGGEPVRLISGATGEGLDELISALTRFCEEYFPAEPALVTRERQR